MRSEWSSRALLIAISGCAANPPSRLRRRRFQRLQPHAAPSTTATRLPTVSANAPATPQLPSAQQPFSTTCKFAQIGSLHVSQGLLYLPPITGAMRSAAGR